MKKLGKRLLLVLVLCLTLALGAAAANTAGAKDAILQGLENHETTIELGAYGLDQNEAWELFQQVLSENPRLFYVRNGGGTLWLYGDTVTSMEVLYLEGIEAEEMTLYETAVEEALRCIQPDMSDLQKALLLHDWLILHCAYDYDNYLQGTVPKYSYSAYGAMVLKTAVCEGYARAYSDLLTRCDIPCITVNSAAMNHTWNQVCLNGSWYHVDVTWDDPTPDTPGQVYHTHFLKSDTAFRNPASGRSHSSWTGGKACTDTRYDSDVFWAELRSAVCFTDANTLWLLRTEGEYTSQTVSLVSRDYQTGMETAAVSVKDYWPVWDSCQYWMDSYSGLALLDEGLYFNDTLHIYRYDVKTCQQTTVLTLTGTDGYLYGLYASDGELYYRVSTTPEESGRLVHLEAEEKQKVSPFADISTDSYFLDAAAWALQAGVTTGTYVDPKTGKVTFSPEDSCNRGQVVTFLWRAMGKPEPKTQENPFPDVKTDDYFYKAVLWAVEQGITNGIDIGGELYFVPDMPCSYAHIITFLWRCVAYVESEGGLWYEAPVAWASENGLLSGVDITDSPADYQCPRKAVVLFLYRCAA